MRIKYLAQALYCRTLLEKIKVQLGTLFVPYLEPLGGKGSQKGSLHVQEQKKVPYIAKNYSKEPKKVIKWF